MDFSVNMPDEDEQLRKAFRTRVPGFDARIVGTGRVFPVKDVSASGVALMDESKSLREGKALELEFFLNRKLFLGGAKCRVMRVLDNGIVGVNFVDLDRHQQIRLDKLVLEVQKRLIELRKAKRAEE